MSEKPAPAPGGSGGVGRLAAPGTRIGRMLGESSELWLNIKFALAIAIASDAALLVLLLSTLKIGWWLMLPVGTLCGFLVGLAGLWTAQMVRIGLTRFAYLALGSLWVVGAILGSVAWWYGNSRIDPALALMGVQLSELYKLAWWWYGLAIVCVVGAARLVRKLWAPVVTCIVLYVGGVAAFSDPEAWGQIGRVLGWLGLPFLWPFGGAAITLIPVMFREMFLPNAEFTLNPVDLRDLGPGGLVSFYLPWLLNEPAPVGDPVPYALRGTLVDENGNEIYLKAGLTGYPAALAWHRFCKAIIQKGKNFSYNEAVKRHKLPEEDYDRIFDTLAAQQWLIPAGQRGTPELTERGRKWVSLYADTPPPKP